MTRKSSRRFILLSTHQRGNSSHQMVLVPFLKLIATHKKRLQHSKTHKRWMATGICPSTRRNNLRSRRHNKAKITALKQTKIIMLNQSKSLRLRYLNFSKSKMLVKRLWSKKQSLKNQKFFMKESPNKIKAITWQNSFVSSVKKDFLTSISTKGIEKHLSASQGFNNLYRNKKIGKNKNKRIN